MRFVLVGGVLVVAAIAACGTDGSGTPTSDASADGSPLDGGKADASKEAAALVPAAPDPGKLACGSETCDVPGSVCCFSSIAPGGAADHCEPNATACGAPNVHCDETADCASGQVCCTGTAVLPRDASVEGFEASTCMDATSAPCIERPGVGSSSIQVCKSDSECKNGKACVVQSCFGRTLQTCGADPSCK
jgi:hypothetical protein